MTIKSKKTGLTHEVSPQEWKKIVDRGQSGKYTVLSKGNARKAENEAAQAQKQDKKEVKK